MGYVLALIFLYWLIRGVLGAFGPSLEVLRGREGERRVHETLTRCLDRKIYHMISDVTLPTENGTAQIDHVVVSPFGVFVIETKTIAGLVIGGHHDATWRVFFRKREYPMRNPCLQQKTHIKALKSVLQLPDYVFVSFVVFAGTAKLGKNMPDEICSLYDSTEKITQYKKQRFTTLEVAQIIEDIKKTRLPPGRKTNKIHVENIQRMRMQ